MSDAVNAQANDWADALWTGKETEVSDISTTIFIFSLIRPD